MASPLSVNKNNYFDKPKKSDIYTPVWLSKWLYQLIESSGINRNIVFDPAIGGGSLTNPFKESGSFVVGADINPNSKQCCDIFMHGKFEELDEWLGNSPDLIVCNPPFNSASGRKLYPEVFLKHIETLFGAKIPLIMICPMGFLLNQRLKSTRWKYIRDNWEVTTIIPLTIDTFDKVVDHIEELSESDKKVLFHCQIVCFNIPQLKPVYFIPEDVLNEHLDN